MNLNQLEYFVCTAETLNFTKAAAKCFISQTAMTQQIHALEKNIGVPLFTRDKHHVELTAAGKVFLNEARIILERSNDAIRLARLTSDGFHGELSIGYINGFGQSDFSIILNRFHSAYPNIKIQLYRNNMSVLIDQLMKKECDIVFTVNPAQESSELQMRYFQSYPVFAVLPEGHKFAGKTHLSYPDLKEEKFIMMQPKTRPKDQMEESMLIYERGGYFPDVIGIEGEQETLMLMVAAGMGIAILPEYIIRNYPRNRDLLFLPLLKSDGTAETIDLCMHWRKINDNPAVDRLLEML